MTSLYLLHENRLCFVIPAFFTTFVQNTWNLKPAIGNRYKRWVRVKCCRAAEHHLPWTEWQCFPFPFLSAAEEAETLCSSSELARQGIAGGLSCFPQWRTLKIRHHCLHYSQCRSRICSHWYASCTDFHLACSMCGQVRSGPRPEGGERWRSLYPKCQIPPILQLYMVYVSGSYLFPVTLSL